MTRYFVPFFENHPATIEIKGHRLLLIGMKEAQVRRELQTVGGDTIQTLEVTNEAEQQTALANLAHSIRGGIVLTPAGTSFSSMLQNLERELPWVH